MLIDEDKVDNDAFLFTLYNAHGIPPTRYAAFKNKSGIRCDPYWGPFFVDIYINFFGIDCYEENSCFMNYDGSNTQGRDSKYKKSLFENKNSLRYCHDFSVEDYEVFSISFKDIDMVIKATGYSLEIKGLEIIEKPLNNPSLFLSGTKIVDIQYDQYLREWLGDEYEWRCIYRASEHRREEDSFHLYYTDYSKDPKYPKYDEYRKYNKYDKCATLIVIKSHNGYIFGGYTTKSWKAMNPNQYRGI